MSSTLEESGFEDVAFVEWALSTASYECTTGMNGTKAMERLLPEFVESINSTVLSL